MLATNSAAKRIYFGESEAIVFFTAIALLVHLLTSGRYDYFHDELYYIARRPADTATKTSASYSAR